MNDKVKRAVVFAAGIVLVAVGVLVSVCVGAKNIALPDVLSAIFNYDEGTLEHVLVHDARLPRALCAVLVGGVLALSGAMMQGVLRNPVAEPSIMGVNQGATLMVSIALVAGLAGSSWRLWGLP